MTHFERFPCWTSLIGERFTVWGLDDADSWVPDAYPGFGHATLLDGDLKPKPAFDAFRRALMRR